MEYSKHLIQIYLALLQTFLGIFVGFGVALVTYIGIQKEFDAVYGTFIVFMILFFSIGFLCGIQADVECRKLKAYSA